MSGLIRRGSPVYHTVRYTSASGREYRMTLLRLVDVKDWPVPSVLIEHPDETYSFGTNVFGSIDECCSFYGCTITGFETADDDSN